VDRTDWLLECYNEPLFFSRDGQLLLPAAEVAKVTDKIFADLEAKPATHTDLITKADISSSSLDRILNKANTDGNVAYTYREGDKQYVYSCHFVNKVNKIASHPISAGEESEGIDLTVEVPGAPIGLLKQLGDALLNESGPGKGTFEIRGDRVQFIPAGYLEGLEKKRKDAYQRAIQDLIEQLREDKYCRVPGQSSLTDANDEVGDESNYSFLRDLKSSLDDETAGSVTELSITGENSTVLVLTERLTSAIETSRIASVQEAARIWHARDGSETLPKLRLAAIKSLEEHLNSPIAKLLLKSPRITEIEPIMLQRFAQLEEEDRLQFNKVVTERLLAPLRLYKEGIETARDETLKQHLEEYVTDFFRRDLVPSVIKALEEQRLLIDKPRKREVERFRQACQEAKNLPDVNAAIQRLAKKMKITVSDEVVRKVKLSSLQQKIRAMKKMGRGSDLLQNLIWVLLAKESDGLFVSSGKDTSRMIKQYQAIGDLEAGKKLEEWRDALKAGKDGDEISEEMRGLATKAVEGFLA
jgi:hypothetical protein